MDHKIELRQLLRNLLERKGDSEPLTDSSSLLLSGRLSSVDSIEIAMFLEERYGIDFAEIGFDQTHMDSIEAIESMISGSSK